ncbi:MAG TPA: alanyl-tRNA editing protein, partial [Blastocatellia bacterium]|nr:alanyl-tRNA editing protein [Blastocatellia bacterium]
MTTKLFWKDSHLIEFAAQVIEVDTVNKTLVLIQTAFYPTSGGQPHDTGRIGEAVVRDVTIEGERIFHHVDDAAKFIVGEEVKCVIDWPRRLEMMQQHTGQHILSQAFFQLFGAETRGFRISDKAGGTAEIDLALELQNDQIQSAISQAEELANTIVFENREIRSFELSPEEAARLPLRKESFVSDSVRVVEIADFDWSPCGGTHAQRTGEVGMIAIRGWERAKKMVRVEFVSGIRALNDYRAANHTAQSIARLFSVGRDDCKQSVAKIIDDNKRLEKRVRELSELAAKAEAEELLSAEA